jgi:hypothetical protein
MNEFIKQNKQLLKFYYITAQILGWLLLAGGFVWFMVFVSGHSPRIDRAENILYIASSYTFDFVLLGVLTIGMAQFIRYLFEAEYKGGRILRVLDKIFYLYALCLVISAAVGYFWYIRVAEQSSIDRLLFAQPLVLPLVAKVLILVGLGQILKRIIPVIEESKTLV